MQEGQDNVKREDPIRTRGTTHNHHSCHSTGPPHKQQGGHHTQDGEANTQPPFTHHATHHPLCHPTIHDGPTLHHDEGGADKGYPTTRTPQTHTHHPHTTHLAGNSARHALQYSPALQWDE